MQRQGDMILEMNRQWSTVWTGSQCGQTCLIERTTTAIATIATTSEGGESIYMMDQQQQQEVSRPKQQPQHEEVVRDQHKSQAYYDANV